MKTSRYMLTFLAGLFLLPALACAGTSDWATNTGGRMRITALPADSQGMIRGAIEIEPESGWITYWREPGEAGIPPQITTPPESGLSVESLRFPPPRLFRQNGLRDIGYDSPVALPFVLKAQQDTMRLKASVFIGICKDICIPFQADFDMPMAQDAAADQRINDAWQSLPQQPSPDFFADKPGIGTDGKTVTVTVTMPASSQEPSFYLTGPEGYVFMEPSITKAGPAETRATFTINELPTGYSLSGKTWNLLAISGNRSMETPLVFD